VEHKGLLHTIHNTGTRIKTEEEGWEEMIDDIMAQGKRQHEENYKNRTSLIAETATEGC